MLSRYLGTVDKTSCASRLCQARASLARRELCTLQLIAPKALGHTKNQQQSPELALVIHLNAIPSVQLFFLGAVLYFLSP